LTDDKASDIEIMPLSERHIEGYNRCLDSVARERRYIGFVRGPSLESSREYVLSNIRDGVPQFVALDGDEVVGWCDISPGKREGFTHCGTLGMGLIRGYRRRGEKRGFVHEGVKRRSRKLDGVYDDILIMALFI